MKTKTNVFITFLRDGIIISLFCTVIMCILGGILISTGLVDSEEYKLIPTLIKALSISAWISSGIICVQMFRAFAKNENWK